MQMCLRHQLGMRSGGPPGQFSPTPARRALKGPGRPGAVLFQGRNVDVANHQLCAAQWQAAVAGIVMSSAASLLLATSPAMAQDCQPIAQAATPPNPLAIIANLFSGEERDPIDAFTLYGTTFKKFSIEKLDGEKIVSRKRGFTVDTCVASALENQETPSFQFLPVGEKVRASGNAECRHAEGSELKPTCVTSCESACTAALEKWEADNELRTGFALLEKDRTRLVRSCTRECATDCTRPGKSYSFVIPYRK